MKSILLLLSFSLFLIFPTWAQSPATNSPISSTPPRKPPTPIVNPNAITPAELTELAAARTAALKAHPKLMASGQELSQKMHAFPVVQDSIKRV